MKIFFLPAFLCLIAALPVWAAELPSAVEFRPNGTFRVDDAEFAIQGYTASWAPFDNQSWKERKETLNPSKLELTGAMPLGDVSAAFTETVTPVAGNAFQLRFQAAFSGPVTLNSLHGVFTIPCREMTVFVDGKPLQLAGETGKTVLHVKKTAKEFRFSTAAGSQVTVTGAPLNLMIQDNRKFGSQTFSVRFKAAPDAGEMTSSALELTFQIEPAEQKSVVIQEDDQWQPLVFTRQINPGSPLDFSFVLDAPAGKYGFIHAAPNGSLTFEQAPEKQIRLYGPNLCFTANFLDKAEVDRLADYLGYCGYNTVRIHHHDTLLTDPEAPDSVTLNPKELDKLDYLVYRMKEKGIYVTTDLFTNRKFKPGDDIPECVLYDRSQMKQLLPLSAKAMENWKAFARAWMLHRNPYTGLSWAEEPALYCINLVNEEPLTLYWNREKPVAALYRAAFESYCAERNLPDSTAANHNPVFRRFLHELQEAVLTEQIRFVKEELKMKALVTSLNCGREIPLALLREHFDAVDNHAYFDHPEFPEKRWNLPMRYTQCSSISQMANVPRDLMPTRLPGKPFLVTEFSYCNPNIYRAEGGPLIGGYAALQNWDALYRFAWSHTERDIAQVVSAYGLNAVNDPLAQFSDRIAIAMFLRNDVESAGPTYSYTVPRDAFEKNRITGFPNDFKNLGLITAVGSLPEDAACGAPDVIQVAPVDAVKPERLNDAAIARLWKQANQDQLAVSSTGQLRLDAKANTFTVVSPRTESITLKSGDLAAKHLRLRDADGFQTVTAISLDGKDLAASDSILLFQLTDVASTGLEFDDASKRIVRYRGNLPLLIRKGAATVELTADRPFTVTALNCDGIPQGTVDGTLQNGVFRFPADTHRFPGGVMAYHLTR